MEGWFDRIGSIEDIVNGAFDRYRNELQCHIMGIEYVAYGDKLEKALPHLRKVCSAPSGSDIKRHLIADKYKTERGTGRPLRDDE